MPDRYGRRHRDRRQSAAPSRSTRRCRPRTDAGRRASRTGRRRARRCRTARSPVSPRACSGLMYWTEPRVIPGSVIWASAIARAIPKSVTSTRPSWASRMLPGLMSRWTIPRAWAAASARATSAAIRADCGRRQRARPAQERRQILAVDVVHDDERPGLVHPEVMDDDDVRRVQRGDRLGFHPEPGHEVGVAAVLGSQDLDRDVPAELAVAWRGRSWPCHPGPSSSISRYRPPRTLPISAKYSPSRSYARRPGRARRAWYRTG